MHPTWHWVDPTGTRSDAHPDRETAIRNAVYTALARSGNRTQLVERSIQDILWNSMQAAGWKVVLQ